MRIAYHIIGVSRDRRNLQQLMSAAAIEQERQDQAIERIWRQRVKANLARRALAAAK